MKLWCILSFLCIFSVHLAKCDICQFLEDVAPKKISDGCLSQLNRSCKNGTIATLMLDATSKYPFTGLLYTNNRDYGNYDECMTVDHTDDEGRILGKHCTLGVVVVNLFLTGHDQDYSPRKLNMPEMLKSQFDRDSQHEIMNQIANVVDVSEKLKPYSLLEPDIKAIKATKSVDFFVSAISSCVPDQCTSLEAGYYMYNVLLDVLLVENASLLYFDDSRCSTKESNSDLSGGDIAFLVVLGIVLLLMVQATVYDYITQKKGIKPHPLSIAFSVYTNGLKLIHTSESTNPEQIAVFNGMRFISMMWVIAGHGFVGYESLALINAFDFKHTMEPITFQYIGSGPVAVDTFFFLSGFLLAYGYFKQIKKPNLPQQLKMIPQMIVHRYLRLTPAAGMTFFMFVTVFRHLGSGPLYYSGTNGLTESCMKNWHAFFFYYQNYYNFDDMCLTQTWYLSADMQMFLLSPLVVIPLTYMVRKTSFRDATIFLAVITVIPVIITISVNFIVEDYSNNFDTHGRLCDYFIGIGLGSYMRINKHKPYPFKKLTTWAIWIVVFSYMILFNWPYNLVQSHPSEDRTGEYFFFGLYRPFWCLSLAWIVYASYYGRAGIISWILSRPIFQFGARISYSMYLLHGAVLAYYILTVRTLHYYSHYNVFYIWCGHFIVTMVASVFWVLAFESPLIVIEKLIFGGGHRKPAPKVEEANTKNFEEGNNNTKESI